MEKLLAYFGYYKPKEHVSTFTFTVKENNEWVVYIAGDRGLYKIMNGEFVEFEVSEFAKFNIALDNEEMESFKKLYLNKPMNKMQTWWVMGDVDTFPHNFDGVNEYIN